MNLEDISFRNAVLYYHEELQHIEDGGKASDVFTTYKRRSARGTGVLTRGGKLTPRTREVLKSIREFLAETKEDWETR